MRIKLCNNLKITEIVPESQLNKMLLEIAGGMMIFPFVSLLVVILLLASMGKSFGIRKAYVELLLRLFEVSGECRYR